MSRSLDHRVAIGPESTFGTPPTAFLSLESSQAQPAINAPKQQSDTIRNDGNVKSSVPLNRSASFSHRQELVYPTPNEGLWWGIRAAMRTTEAAAAANANTATLVAGGATITRLTGSWVTDGFRRFDLVKVTGAANAADNRYVPVSEVSDLTLTLALPDSELWLGSDEVTVTRGARMVNGTTDYSATIEEVWLSTQKMVGWPGHRVGGVEFGFSMGSKSSVALSLVGQDGIPGDMATATQGYAGATYTDYTESQVMTPADTILAVVNGEALPCASMSVAIDSGARVRHSTAGGATPDAIRTGATRVRVSITSFAEVLSVLTQHRSGSSVPVWVVMDAPDGKAVAVSLGNVTWDTATLPTSSVDADAVITASGVATLTAQSNPNTPTERWDSTVIFQRFE